MLTYRFTRTYYVKASTNEEAKTKFQNILMSYIPAIQNVEYWMQQEFPKLLFWFQDEGDDSKREDHFECEKGWHPIINEALTKIERIIIRDNLPEITISQIKEKLGGLRIYLSSTTPEIEEVIREAEGKALTTCELCGKPGYFLSNMDGWYMTRCDDCLPGGVYQLEHLPDNGEE